MDYLWRNYDSQKFYKLDSSFKNSSPSLEISLRKDDIAIVNPLPRFTDIFDELLSPCDSWKNQESDVKALSNCLLHFLARLDRLSGMSVSALYEEKLNQDLLNGCFGESAKKIYENLNSEQKQLILEFLRRQESTNGRRLYFREVLKAIYPKSSIYFYHAENEFLICLPQKENESDRKIVKLIQILFLDVTSEYRIYWEYPFGIIGQNRTMRLDRMKMY